jgi:transcriptional regulator of acetoin/glycerol metabolism
LPLDDARAARPATAPVPQGAPPQAPPPQAPPPQAPPRKARLNDAERAFAERLRASLAEHDGNVTKVAEATGVRRQQLYRWFRRFGIEYDQFR